MPGPAVPTVASAGNEQKTLVWETQLVCKFGELLGCMRGEVNRGGDASKKRGDEVCDHDSLILPLF